MGASGSLHLDMWTDLPGQNCSKDKVENLNLKTRSRWPIFSSMGIRSEKLVLLNDETSDDAEWVEVLRRTMTFDESDAGLEIVEDQSSEETPDGSRRSLRDLVWRANNDSLTMLSNRGWFLRCAESSRAALQNAGHSHLLLLLDLDKFKAINDTRGHSAGDAVLAEVGNRLRHITRSGDIVGRMGGDEFAVWAERVHAAEASEVAHRYLEVFSTPVHLDGVAIEIAGSIGVVATDGSQSVTEVLDLADAALYEAKHRGTGSFCVFDHTLQARIDETNIREREIVDAVLNAEFQFDVQPIVSLQTDAPVGYEALARWDSPRRGRLLPGEFLQYVHSMNLTRTFDAMIIEQAVSAFASWRYNLRTAAAIWVNISPTQLEASFPELVSDILERYGISNGELVLELTENAAANTPGRIAVLNALRERGVRIAIDDFGTGHSQLSYLQDLPIDFVKLDRSFVSGFHSDQRRTAITASIISLAQALGAQVVAEGVERPEELAKLRELGCDHAQGYLLQPPGSPEDLLGF
jgi:diguanylate cyclase (GGDEF)-like protein